MQLWGKVVSGALLLFAAVFLIVAFAVVEARSAALAAAAICVAVALWAVPLVVLTFSSFTGDEALLENGRLARAKIVRLEPTRWRYNRTDPIVRFALEVEPSGAVYPARVTQAVDPGRLAELAPGTLVAVRVDPENRARVVIDWREPRGELALPSIQPGR